MSKSLPRRALLSVFDKTGLVELATALAGHGVELVSTGGTARALREAGLEVVDVSAISGRPEILDGRVKTLQPEIHGGILARRADPAHMAVLAEHGIATIDLVVVNLYPFEATVQKPDVTRDAAIEQIDIGGPTMLRSAAKNHASVTVVCDPTDYERVAAAIDAGDVPETLRRDLARKVFAHTASYDAAIARWLAKNDAGEAFPDVWITSMRRERELRYGENPHQRAALYRSDGADPWWANATQHGGVALSYLNLFDADAAWLLAHDLGAATGGKAAVAIIKHANPCGAAVSDSLADAYQKAFDCDPRSAFGGIVALNRPVDDETVEAMVAAAQADLVIAPSYGPGVVERLQAKRKNTRLLEAPAPVPNARHLRPITGGWLVQEPHRVATPVSEWKVVTDRQPSQAEMDDAALAFRICAAVSSNAIVLVKDGIAWGIGAGQQNRVESGQIAAQKADGRAAGGACASDAFYPFADGIEAAAGAGVAVIVQPGGSVRDEETIAKANELGVAMVFTGERQFKH
ncbi:MAG: bifunctional phosphoribosylaminoimidazolecarboxamide formyltransferase/IMP cyclohydrolase [Acidimicrobiales bacterium]|nr:bifunctional phosphoribosylaminoimidazolecarboxamide formyltransferase/IMP cyclohydrolase [Acidimicrobiales bacterium]